MKKSNNEFAVMRYVLESWRAWGRRAKIQPADVLAWCESDGIEATNRGIRAEFKKLSKLRILRYRGNYYKLAATSAASLYIIRAMEYSPDRSDGETYILQRINSEFKMYWGER